MIDYSPFWETLAKKGLNPYKLEKHYGYSTSTLSRIRNGKNINTKTINDLCEMLDCDVCDILKHIPDKDCSTES